VAFLSGLEDRKADVKRDYKGTDSFGAAEAGVKIKHSFVLLTALIYQNKFELQPLQTYYCLLLNRPGGLHPELCHAFSILTFHMRTAYPADRVFNCIKNKPKIASDLKLKRHLDIERNGPT